MLAVIVWSILLAAAAFAVGRYGLVGVTDRAKAAWKWIQNPFSKR